MKKRSWFSLKGKLNTTLLGGLFALATSLSFGQATLPYSEDFTASTGWTFANGTETNQWHIGSATGNTGNSLYISENGGLTNTYKILELLLLFQKYMRINRLLFRQVRIHLIYNSTGNQKVNLMTV